VVGRGLKMLEMGWKPPPRVGRPVVGVVVVGAGEVVGAGAAVEPLSREDMPLARREGDPEATVILIAARSSASLTWPVEAPGKGKGGRGLDGHGGKGKPFGPSSPPFLFITVHLGTIPIYYCSFGVATRMGLGGVEGEKARCKAHQPAAQHEKQVDTRLAPG
jgi:hypothetical protein